MNFRTKRKKWLIAASVLAIGFIGIQFIPVQRNQSSAIFHSDFINVYPVPDAVQNKLWVACYDCHSNNTRYPWYNNVQPVAWFLESHVAEGKAELNFSEWDAYSARRKRNKLKSIISQISDDKMPPSSYALMHRDAILSKEEKKSLLEWLQQLKDSL